MGPRYLDTILGITKAYTTRVGEGPFATELFDSNAEQLAKVGHEFGATTGRPRRCGWLDLKALETIVFINSVTNLCLTKLDVLDGFDEIKVCIDYDLVRHVAGFTSNLLQNLNGVHYPQDRA